MRPALLMFLVACEPASVGDSGAPDTTDTTDTDTPDTGDTEEPYVPVEGFGNLDWELHDDHGTVIFLEWEQDETGTVHVEYRFGDSDWIVRPSVKKGPGTHRQPIVGMPYETDVEWRLVIEEAETVEPQTLDGETATTDDYPRDLPVPELLVSEPDQWLPGGNYLLTSINEDAGGWRGGTYWTVIYDRQGELIWASKTPESHWTLFAQVSVTRDHILWDEATLWSDWDEGAASTVHRVYLDSEIEEIATPGLHHAFVQLPDETLVWGSQHHGGGEALVEKPVGTDQEIVLWSCASNWPGSGNNCESNGLFYVESTNSFLYSFYTNNSMVEVSRDSGESMWWAGEVDNGYEFDPPGSQFSWQHGVSYTDEGTLLVSTEAHNPGPTTMVREYIVDHDAETLTQVWSYDPDIYASTNGDAWRLDNGNTLHVVGSAGHALEVNADGETVWHLDWGSNHLMGRGELIEDLYTLVSDDY